MAPSWLNCATIVREGIAVIAAVAGGKVPMGCVIDGVNQLDFFTGKQETSNRDTVIVYVGDQLYTVKWRNWKAAFKELDAGYGAAARIYQTPSIYDLYLDPERPVLRPQQAVVRLLQHGGHTRAASCFKGVARQVPGPVRPRLGHAAGVDLREATGDGHHSQGNAADGAA
jgi:hypothetical protein